MMFTKGTRVELRLQYSRWRNVNPGQYGTIIRYEKGAGGCFLVELVNGRLYWFERHELRKADDVDYIKASLRAQV